MRFQTTLEQDDKTTGTYFVIPGEVVEALGGKRVPVRGEINGVRYRGWAVCYRGAFMLGIRRDQRAEMGIAAGDQVTVVMERDVEKRLVETPPDLAAALSNDPAAAAAWEALSSSLKRRCATAIAEAKKPETRARRIEKTLGQLRRG